MAGSLTNIQIIWSNGSTRELENSSEQSIANFLPFNDFNNNVETTKGKEYVNLLKTLYGEHFKVLSRLITEVFLQCELLLEANSVYMDNYQDIDRYFINIYIMR